MLLDEEAMGAHSRLGPAGAAAGEREQRGSVARDCGTLVERRMMFQFPPAAGEWEPSVGAVLMRDAAQSSGNKTQQMRTPAGDERAGRLQFAARGHVRTTRG